jgi:hypothetical protein
MGQRPFLFCLVAPDRAEVLLPRLIEHFADDPRVAVLVERRSADDRSARPGSEQRAPVVTRDIVRALPPGLRREARHLRFVQRLEPVRRTHAYAGNSDLLAQVRAGDPEAATELWWRFHQRVRIRLRSRLGDDAAADSAGPEVLGRLLDAIDAEDPSPERLGEWIDQLVDRYVAERNGQDNGARRRTRASSTNGRVRSPG